MTDWFVLAKKEKISKVADRWAEQYAVDAGEPKWRADKRKLIEPLQLAKTAKEIEKIIGNDTWTKHYCYCCGAEKEHLICLDDGDSIFMLCKLCLLGMVDALPELEE